MCITQIYGLDVMIGGESIGIVLNYDAICITGFYDIEVNQQIIDPSHYFKINDLIIEVENQKVTSIEELTNSIKALSTNAVHFIVEREGKQIPIQMDIYKKGDEFSTGLYVKDSTKGIGTVTYYRMDTNEFASLGHCLNDNENIIEQGNVYEAPISSIKKSSNLEMKTFIATYLLDKQGELNKADKPMVEKIQDKIEHVFDKANDYERIKEKLIGETFEYAPKFDYIINGILMRYENNPDLIRFLRENTRLIISTFNKSGTRNLRILKHALNDFKKIFEMVNKSYPNTNNRVMQTMLIFTIAISFEIKAGKITKEKFKNI